MNQLPAPPEADVQRVEFTIPDWRPPTLNRLMRGKLRTRMKLGSECREFIGTYFLLAGLPRAIGRRRVSLRITLSGKQRPCDVDSPWKAILDALKACGAILDDSARWCEIGRLEFSRGDRTSTSILIESA